MGNNFKMDNSKKKKYYEDVDWIRLAVDMNR